MPTRKGRKSAAQTPAPPSERIYGSAKNPSGSAASERSASKIALSAKIILSLKDKLSQFKKDNPNKSNVTLNDLKAVYRRGLGAYSSTHRPTITGGKPNTRNAWAMARVNKFLEKASGKKVKAAYVQDDDLLKMQKGGATKQYLDTANNLGNSDFDSLGDATMKKGGMILTEEQKEDYAKWKSLVNMSKSELEKFYESEEGKEAGLSKDEARSQGISSGRESARWIMRMKDTPVSEWTPEMWRWANKQISFISRMSGNKGKLYDENGKKTRKHTSLLIWGHNPKKYESGGNIALNIENQNDMKTQETGYTVSEVAEKHGIPVEVIKTELVMGIRNESKEHKEDFEKAKKIALDHLWENPRYYSYLNEMEQRMASEDVDDYFKRIRPIYAKGGSVDKVYSFTTPTGEKSGLNYLQQVLVRTKEFKAWFGDWETAAKNFIASGKKDFDLHFAGVSKVLNLVTLEPLLVYHGTNRTEEFFKFDVTMEQKMGRPYGYFADNKEYSLNFSQRGGGDGLLYQCFLNIKKPFYALGRDFEDVHQTYEYWFEKINNRLYLDIYNENPNKNSKEYKLLSESTKSQLEKYARSIYGDDDYAFWRFMSGDTSLVFKIFMMNYGYDGIRYTEEFSFGYSTSDPSQYTKAWVIFSNNQVKLADGRNIDFDPFNQDIRFEEGGKTNDVDNQQVESRFSQIRRAVGASEPQQSFEVGGKVKTKSGYTTNAKRGGYFDGRSHNEGGIKAVNTDTEQLIEVEGDEVIINKKSVLDPTKREFEGQMLTNKQILSRINESGGGVSFAEGGTMKAKDCGCTGKKYKFGGELLEDYEILRRMDNLSQSYYASVMKSVEYVDDLTKQIYG